MKIIDISEPTAEEIYYQTLIDEIYKGYLKQAQPYVDILTNLRMRRTPKYQALIEPGDYKHLEANIKE